MLRKTSIFVVVSVLILTFAVAAIAQGPAQDPAPGPIIERAPRPAMDRGPMPMPYRGAAAILRIPLGPALNGLGSRLALTDEQMPKVQALSEKAIAKMKPLMKEQSKSSEALLKAITEPKTTAADVQKASEAVAKAETSVLTEEVAFWVELKGLLTPEQNNQLKDVLIRRGGPIMPPPQFGGPPPQFRGGAPGGFGGGFGGPPRF